MVQIHKQTPLWLIGIDEVGRGSIAGPVTVGLVCIAMEIKEEVYRLVTGVRDSKKLTERARERWFMSIKEFAEQDMLIHTTASISAKHIDTHGIVHALEMAIMHGLQKCNSQAEHSLVLLDGALRAPKQYAQKTIIRGDETEPIISLASIVAKCTRDAAMCEYANQYPEYGFEKHKGYGTRMHQEMVKKHGMCPIHRRSFIKTVS